MNKISLEASARTVSGRKVKKLRKDGVVPANIFGRKLKSLMIQVNTKEFSKVFGQAGETGLIDLSVGKEKRPVLVHNVQKDPVSDEILHVDFLQVDLKQKVSAMVPVQTTGEAPAEKQGIGTVVQYIDELEVEALPEDLPDKFEIDLSGLEEVDQAIMVKDIKINAEKVEVKKDLEEIIVKVEPQKEEKEEVVETPTEEAAGETPATTEEGTATEGKAEETEKPGSSN